MTAQNIPKENQSTLDDTYRFGDFELKPGERVLLRAGEVLPLPPKTFDALLYFVRNAERLCRKNDLMDTLWPSTFVTEANLTNIVATLRKALGHDAIRTVSKHGYRFAMKVQGVPGMARDVYERFVRANELVTHRSLESMMQARELYWVCLARDPAFAPAWAWLGRCCWFLAKFGDDPASGFELAEAAFRRAFLIDPDLAAAHQFYTPVEADLGGARRALVRLLGRLERAPAEPESFGGLVQVLRFCGLLEESVAGHRRARDLDSTIVTSLAHTLFLSADYAAAIDAYGGRSGYYLDAAAWAALGEKSRASALLRERLPRMQLSSLMRGLMESLAAVLDGRCDDAHRCMSSMQIGHEPEAMVYLARHYGQMGMADLAIDALKQSAEAGFTCAPETLRADPWLGSVRTHPGFSSILAESEMHVAQVRAIVQRYRPAFDTAA